MTDEEPAWKKRLRENRTKAAKQRGGGKIRGKGGAGRLSGAGRRKLSRFRRCDMCGRKLNPNEPRHEVGESVYCSRCAKEKGLI